MKAKSNEQTLKRLLLLSNIAISNLIAKLTTELQHTKQSVFEDPVMMSLMTAKAALGKLSTPDPKATRRMVKAVRKILNPEKT